MWDSRKHQRRQLKVVKLHNFLLHWHLFPICHHLSPFSHSQHLKISFYFLFPSFFWVFPFFSILPVLEWRILGSYPPPFSLGDLTTLCFARLSILYIFSFARLFLSQAVVTGKNCETRIKAAEIRFMRRWAVCAQRDRRRKEKITEELETETVLEYIDYHNCRDRTDRMAGWGTPNTFCRTRLGAGL